MDNQDWDELDPARSKLRALSERVNRGLVELVVDGGQQATLFRCLGQSTPVDASDKT